jgi:hypothetical protein
MNQNLTRVLSLSGTVKWDRAETYSALDTYRNRRVIGRSAKYFSPPVISLRNQFSIHVGVTSQ